MISSKEGWQQNMDSGGRDRIFPKDNEDAQLLSKVSRQQKGHPHGVQMALSWSG